MRPGAEAGVKLPGTAFQRATCTPLNEAGETCGKTRLCPGAGKSGLGRPPGSKDRRPEPHHGIGMTVRRDLNITADNSAQMKDQARPQSTTPSKDPVGDT